LREAVDSRGETKKLHRQEHACPALSGQCAARYRSRPSRRSGCSHVAPVEHHECAAAKQPAMTRVATVAAASTGCAARGPCSGSTDRWPSHPALGAVTTRDR
jgi:hypothetical protein